MWKKKESQSGAAIRVAEVPRGRTSLREKRASFVAFYRVSPPLDEILEIDGKKRKRRAIGTVYAFSFFFSCTARYHIYFSCVCIYTYMYTYIRINMYV